MALAQYRPRGVTAISPLSAVQSLLRLVFFYLSVTGAELLEVEIASSADDRRDVPAHRSRRARHCVWALQDDGLGVLGHDPAQPSDHRVRCLGPHNAVHSRYGVGATNIFRGIPAGSTLQAAGGDAIG